MQIVIERAKTCNVIALFYVAHAIDKASGTGYNIFEIGNGAKIATYPTSYLFDT